MKQKLKPFLACFAVIFLFPSMLKAQSWQQLNKKAIAFNNAGETDFAIFYEKLALARAEVEFTRFHENYCTILGNLGYLYSKMKDYKKVQDVYKDLSAIRKKIMALKVPNMPTRSIIWQRIIVTLENTRKLN